jgi:hypothetical protein
MLRRRRSTGRGFVRAAAIGACGALGLAILIVVSRGWPADGKPAAKETAGPVARGGSIEGFVRDEKGQPIAGAGLENFDNRSNRWRRGNSDGSGHYVLDDLLESSGGYHVVIARAPGRAASCEIVKPGSKVKPTHVDFTLERGHLLHGRIMGENGKPISEAIVSMANDSWGLVEPKLSDAMGRFEMELLPARARLQISKPGYSSLLNLALRFDGTGTTTVMLEPMGVIRGRVVGAESKQPLARFRLWIDESRRPLRGAPSSRVGYLGYPGKRFDAKDGTFSIDELIGGSSVELGIAADGYWRKILPPVIARPADEAKPIEIALERVDSSTLATITGRLVDYLGRGVPHANVRLIVSASSGPGSVEKISMYNIKNGAVAATRECEQFMRTVSDSDGRFEFKNVLPGKPWLLAYWGVHVPQGSLPGVTRTQAGKSESLTVTLPQPGRIVVTIDRAKYPEAERLYTQSNNEWWQEFLFGLGPGQTRCEMEDMPPGKYVVGLQGKAVAIKGQQGTYYTFPSFGTRTIELKAGEAKNVAF